MQRGQGILAVLVLSGAAAFAQPTVAVKVRVDNVRALERVVANSSPKAQEERGGVLIEAFFNAVRANAKVTVVPRGVSDDASSKVGRSDELRDSNVRLGEFAKAASATYGIYATVSLDPYKTADASYSLLKVKARVVRRDGVLSVHEMERTAQLAKPNSATIHSTFVGLARDLVKDLSLDTLPETISTSPPPSTSPSTEGANPDWPIGLPAPPSPPPPQLASPSPHPGDSSTQSLIGKIGVVSGAGVAALGGVLLGLASGNNARLTQDAADNLPPAQQGAVRALQAKQRAGLGLVVAGGVVAAAGALVWILAPAAPVSVSAGPVGSGTGVFVGGTLP